MNFFENELFSKMNFFGKLFLGYICEHISNSDSNVLHENGQIACIKGSTISVQEARFGRVDGGSRCTVYSAWGYFDWNVNSFCEERQAYAISFSYN